VTDDELTLRYIAELLDELAGGRLRQAGQPELDAVLRHGTQRPLGGASRS